LGKDEDIFSEDYETKKKDDPESIEQTPKDESRPEVKKEVKEEKHSEIEKPQKTVSEKKSSKKYAGIGAIVIGLIIVGMYGMIAGFFDFDEFDSTQCSFGVVSDFMGSRCMTQQEFDLAQTLNQQKETSVETRLQIQIPEETPISNPDEPFKDVSSTSDKVELSLNDGISGYYMISSPDDWYGDFVDIHKVPKKIEKSGNMKVNFICFDDDHLRTSTYFGTFRNVIDPNLTVEVYIGGLEVDSKTTTSGSALILEGSCYGHES